jgi:hypothetical protein
VSDGCCCLLLLLLLLLFWLSCGVWQQLWQYTCTAFWAAHE